MKISKQVIELLEVEPSVLSILLSGSRARGEQPTELSDWDFAIETDDFGLLARRLPDLVGSLQPLAAQWDRLSPTKCYMLIVLGPVKVDFTFSEPNESKPPWKVDARNISKLNEHFWDWTLWLASKQLRGKNDLVGAELEKMFHHLLSPMGIGRVPADISEAIEVYKRSLSSWSSDFNMQVATDLQREMEACGETGSRIERLSGLGGRLGSHGKKLSR